MASDREAVLKKFSGLMAVTKPNRRVDYKGNRNRINLRMPGDIASGLQLIKLASGEDKNTFCERILKAGITHRLTELKAKHDQAAWQALTDVAGRKRQS